ncbi:MAG: hypothetical protein FWE76_03035 [Symbiobacteriaceae bacterium]|nr:hypothetical protein [Symbiobacteriaceae bacterium]
MNDMAVDYRNPALVRKAGLEALTKELGVVGAVYFMRQYTQGAGNYTADRGKLLEGLSLGEVISEAKEHDKRLII